MTRRRILRSAIGLTLSGDGLHTPIVQAFQYAYPPIFTEPPTQWFDFTEWVRECSIECTAEQTTLSRLGPVMRQGTLQIVPNITAGGLTLAEWLSGTLAGTQVQWLGLQSLMGDYAVQLKTGMAYDDGSFAQIVRLTGMLTIHENAFPVEGIPTQTWTVHDRVERFSKTALLWAPSVAGLDAATAVSTIAQWAGVAPSQIEIAAGYTFNTLTEPAGDPTKLFGDWTQPTWYPKNGTRADEFD